MNWFLGIAWVSLPKKVVNMDVNMTQMLMLVR